MTARAPKTEEVEPTSPRYTYATGRRKTAVAQIRLLPQSTVFLINDREAVIDPRLTRLIDLVGLTQKIGISAHVHGGGKEGQVQAIIHGVARALVEFNADFRTTLKKAGYLTRDPRERERKKPGLRSARRAPQFSKR